MRYAIYYTPPETSGLAARARLWLGRNPFDGSTCARPHPFADEVAGPRRYGFHATLKAPFRLADGYSEAHLIAAFMAFAARQKSVVLNALVLHRLDSFFALVPGARSADLQDLADTAVSIFEPFRASLSEAEIARRRPETLTPRQRDYLASWGYPYVLEEFRFHLTLSGPIRTPEGGAALERALQRHFGPDIGQPLILDMIALFVEPAPGADFIIRASAYLGENSKTRHKEIHLR